MATGYFAGLKLSHKQDRYMSVLEDGNTRHPLYYDARAYADMVVGRYLEMRINYAAKILPVHTSDRSFQYVRKNGHKVLKLSYADVMWLFKHLIYGITDSTTLTSEFPSLEA